MSKYADMKDRLNKKRERTVHDVMIQPVEDNSASHVVDKQEAQQLEPTSAEDDALSSVEEERKTMGRPAKLKVKPMTITIDQDLFQRFDDAVWKIRGNKSEIIRQLIHEWLRTQK